MSLKKKQTIGYRYYMTLQMGIGRGEIDSLLEIKVGDRIAWQDVMKEPGEFAINQPTLFGGDQAEGGIDGTAELMLGRPNQKVSDKIKNWLGGIVPDFRGCTTMIFDGLVCSMSAYPKTWKMKVHRTLRGWDGDVWQPDLCRINMEVPLSEGGSTFIIGMNPAHILYQVCTDSVWGRGMPRSLMDEEAWTYAAQKLYDENFGLCIAWRRSDNLDAFAQDIIDTIGATLYVDKKKGRMVLKLIRDDYDMDSVPMLDHDSGLLSIEEMSLASGSEAVNEVVVKYHDPITNQDASVREQSLAAIQINTAVNSKSQEYLAVPTPALAARLAKRDLRIATLPLKTFQITCDRRAWYVQPGDVIRIKDDTRDQADIALRVGSVTDGTLTDGKVTISAVEDVFIMPVKGTGGVQPSQYVPPDKTPKPTKFFSYEIPYANLNRELPQADFNAIGFNTGYYGMAAEKNVPMSMGYVMLQQPIGGEWQDNGGGGGYNPVGQLVSTIDYMTSTITISNTTMSDEIEAPCAVYIGDNFTGEILMVKDVSGIGGSTLTLTVERGIYDTIPSRHDKGTDVWFYEDDIGADWVERIGGEFIEGKCCPYTLSAPPLDPNLVDNQEIEFDWRYSRPYAPGRVYMNGAMRWYNRAEISKVQPVLEITWTHRDRVAQEDRMISHDHDSIGPEAGSRYVVKIFDQDKNVIREEKGIDGTSWSYLWAQAIKDLNIDVQNSGDEYPIKIYLWTTRDDLGSWQYYEMNVIVKDVQFYLQASQAAAQSANTMSVMAVDGVAATTYAEQAATEADYGAADGVGAANYAMAVNQLSAVEETIDYQAMEAPYYTQIVDGFTDLGSRVMTFAARPSDRITDSHEVWSNKMKMVTKHDSKNVPYTVAEEDGEWRGGGSFKWTPWAITTEDVGFLDGKLSFGKTSVDDGVELGVNVGDIILVDRELMRVNEVASTYLLVGRGSADTIPSRHYTGAVVWMMQSQHGIDSNTYDDEQLVGVKVRPITYSPVSVPLSSLRTTVLQMAYRYKRPYAPGLMMIDGKHWFENVDAVQDGTPKNLLLTWRHRNRITQGVNLVDHWHDDIDPEPNTKYRVQVGYTVPSQTSSTEPRMVVLHDDLVDGTEWTYRAEWAIADGMKAGNDLKQSGQTQVWVTVFAVRDGVRSWHGYTMYINLPSYDPAPGEKPNVPNGENGHGGGDTPDKPGTPGTTDPSNPNGGDDSPSVTPNPQNPDIKPDLPGGADPDDPVPTPEPEKPTPDPTPEDEVKGSWSYNYDHVWARNLPPTV